MKLLKRIEYYLKISHATEILRRYFVINAFDGILTTLGVLVGANIAGLTNKEVTLVALSAAISMGISGIGGVLLSEKAEREREINELERDMLKNLDSSLLGKAHKLAIWISALVDGFSPLLACLLIISPYFFLPSLKSFWISFFISAVLLSTLGAYLGKISKKNIWLSALQMLLVGLIAVLILMLFKTFKF